MRTLVGEFNLHGFKMLKPNWKAGWNWKFTEDQGKELAALAASGPRDLGLPYAQWSLSRLRAEAISRRLVASISLEWLRVILDEAEVSHPSIKSWRESKAPKFAERKERVDRFSANMNRKVSVRGRNFSYATLVLESARKLALSMADCRSRFDLGCPFPVVESGHVDGNGAIIVGSMCYKEARERGISEAGLWGLKRRAAEGKPLKLYQKVSRELPAVSARH